VLDGYPSGGYYRQVIKTIIVTKVALRQLSTCPKQVQKKFRIWVANVEESGVKEVRRVGGKGLHDEPLAGDRAGQRSIRLGKGYRAFYTIGGGEMKLLQVIEVNKHDY
jgi:plasmid maintenance system killer protein